MSRTAIFEKRVKSWSVTEEGHTVVEFTDGGSLVGEAAEIVMRLIPNQAIWVEVSTDRHTMRIIILGEVPYVKWFVFTNQTYYPYAVIVDAPNVERAIVEAQETGMFDRGEGLAVFPLDALAKWTGDEPIEKELSDWSS